MSVLKSLFMCALVSFSLFILLIKIFSNRIDIASDYTRSIEVDDSSKIEQAISNAVNDVKSRNFVVHQLNVQYDYAGSYVIKCGGIDRGNLLKK